LRRFTKVENSIVQLLKTCPLTFYNKVEVNYSDLSLDFIQQGSGQLLKTSLALWVRTRLVKNRSHQLETPRVKQHGSLGDPPFVSNTTPKLESS